jgi:hypothetical protein
VIGSRSGFQLLAERAITGLNYSAMRNAIRGRQADTPVKTPAVAFLK